MNSTVERQSLTTASVVDLLHGVEVEDRFRWLEDQDSLATRSFIRTEQEAYREYLCSHSSLRASIEARVTELLTIESVQLPIPDGRGGLLYLRRRAEEEQKSIYRRAESGEDRLLLSIQILGRDVHTSLAILQVDPTGRYLVFALRIGGEDVQEIGIFDLEQNGLLPDRLPCGFYRGLVFDPEGAGFYYVHEETEGVFSARHAVRHHVFGEDQSNDREIFHGGDGSLLRLVVQQSEDNSCLGYSIVSLESEPRTRIFIHRFPLTGPPEQIADLRGASFRARFNKQFIEALTTYGAPLGRVVLISAVRNETANWIDIIPQTGKRLSTYERLGTMIVAHYVAGTTASTCVYASSGKLLREIFYPERGTSNIGRVDAVNSRLFFAHSDITTPPAIYEIDLKTGKRSCWWQQRAPKVHVEPVIEERSYTSADGTTIPLTLVHPSGQTGPHPVLLSAYGGGAVNSTPHFSVLLTILIEAGVSCATAHVRGGGEGGLQWHVSAQKQRKQTSVDDLIAAAHWLIDTRLTTPDALGVAGQSHGALLTLCAATQQPRLFRAALALGPIADLTRFHLFGVASGFVAELGSPDHAEEFYALLRLSPYHGVRNDEGYPAVLVISGDRDKRCDAMHARKMVARLHEAGLQRQPILLDYTELRGHKPALPLTARIQSLTDRLTFLIAELSSPRSSEVAS